MAFEFAQQLNLLAVVSRAFLVVKLVALIYSFYPTIILQHCEHSEMRDAELLKFCEVKCFEQKNLQHFFTK